MVRDGLLGPLLSRLDMAVADPFEAGIPVPIDAVVLWMGTRVLSMVVLRGL